MVSEKLFSYSKYFIEHSASFVLFTLLAPLVFLCSPCVAVLMTCVGSRRGLEGSFCFNFILCLLGPPLAIVVFPIAAATSFALGIGMGLLGTFARMAECCFCVEKNDVNDPAENYRRKQARDKTEELQRENAQLRKAAQAAELAKAVEIKTAMEAKARVSEAKKNQIISEKDALIAKLYQDIAMERDKARQAEIKSDRESKASSRPPAYNENSQLLTSALPTYDEALMEGLYNRYFRREFIPNYPEVNARLGRFFSMPNEAQRPYHVLGGPLTDDQIAAMQQKLTDKDPIVKRLFETAVMGNDIAGNIREVMRIPVLLFGRVYDLAYLDALPMDEHGIRVAPGNVIFKSEDIVPYNTLGEAISFLLRDIQAEAKGNAITERQVNDELGIIKGKKPSIKRAVLSNPSYRDNNDIEMLEGYYNSLPPRHKKLFNIMCRDPLTGLIFQNPVTLADGNAYEKIAVDSYRRELGVTHQNCPCPNNTAVYFKESQIQKCNPICNILDLLKHEITWTLAAGYQPQRLSA